MQDVQKQQICRLRGEGLGYKAIASQLDLSVDAVKSFCRRLKAKADANAEKCQFCGLPLQKTKHGGDRKKFCSSKCRSAWNNRRQKERTPEDDTRHVCACCGHEFFAYAYKQRRYCSRDCYIKARFGEARA
jgi:hypothetical protein